jgi:hypothetical protein
MPTGVLQFQRDGNRLLVSHMHRGERVDSLPFEDAALLERWAGDFSEIMERALAFPLNDHRDVLEDFGRCLFDNLVTGGLAELFPTLPPERPIIVDLRSRSCGSPSKRCSTARDFFGVKHAVGRRITTWENGASPGRAVARRDGRDRPAFLLVAGYAEDDAFFEETRNEIYDLCSAIERSGAFEMRELLVDNSIGRAELLRALSSADYVHFSGHSDSGEEGSAGWLFEKYRLSPSDVASLSGCDPNFVFSNSCRSGAVSNWRETRDMVRSFWGRGTRHFIGANTRIHYKRAAEYAEAFYGRFLKGETIGESMRQARLAVLDNPSHHDVCWLSYVLYGDPRYQLPVPGAVAAKAANERAAESRVGARDARLDGARRDQRAGTGSAPYVSPTGVASALQVPTLLCAWTGKPLLASSAARCAHPGCDKMLGLDAQIEQRRLALDRAVHAGATSAAAPLGGRAVYCRDHLPSELAEWASKAQKVEAKAQAGAIVCAWTGRAATRSELLTGAFKAAAGGMASPEALKRYVCAETGEMIAPALIRENRGYIELGDRLFSEEGYWRKLGLEKRRAVAAGDARASEERARRAMAERLRKLVQVEIDGKNYLAGSLSEPLRETDAEVAWMLKLDPGWIGRSKRLGVAQRVVAHAEHFERFGRDRQPATLEELERTIRLLEPIQRSDETLFLLSSPTGWANDARDFARALEPGATTVILRHAGEFGEPLVFNRKSATAEALKIDLAGGAGLI